MGLNYIGLASSLWRFRGLSNPALKLGQEQCQELLGRVVQVASFKISHKPLNLNLEHRGIVPEILPELPWLRRPSVTMEERKIDLLSSLPLISSLGVYLRQEFRWGSRAAGDRPGQ
jgi:hypothetical protein